MTTTHSSDAVLIPLGDLEIDDRGERHYVLAGGDRPRLIRAADDRAALRVAVATMAAGQLSCVPELAAAARDVGVGETSWTPELRAMRACEALRYAYPFDFNDNISRDALRTLLDGCAKLFAAAPARAETCAMTFASEGRVGGASLKREGVMRATIGGDPLETSILVFASAADALAEDDVPHLSLHFSDQPADALVAIGEYEPLAAAPTPLSHDGMPRAVDDLECVTLAALCHALATHSRSGWDPHRVHLLAADTVNVTTRVVHVDEA